MKLNECAGVSEKEMRSTLFWRDVLSEFFATFFLVSIQCALPLTWGSGLGKPEQVGIAMGFIVCTMAWTLGDYGGGHMNPAVTFTMAACMKISIMRAFCYIVVQVLGGIVGAAFVYGTTPANMTENLGATQPGPGVEGWQAFLIEAWITAILLITVLGSTNAKRKKGKTYMHTIPIGFAVALGIMTGFGSTGGSMNPARSFGPAVIMGIWTEHWVYWVGPFAGGLFGAFVYSVLMEKMSQKDDDEEEQEQYGVGENPQSNNAEINEVAMSHAEMTRPGPGPERTPEHGSEAGTWT